MKKKGAVLAAALCAAVLFSGCFANPAPSSSAPEGGQSAVSQSASSATTQTVSSASSAGSRQASSQVSSRGGVSSQGGMVKTESTDSNEFNDRFKNNPIDKAYISEMKGALSNVDMVKVSNKYAQAWDKEVSHAYAALKDALMTSSSTKWKTIEDGQKAWTDGKAAALKKINDDAAAAGGSMAQVDAASKTMDFYRDRAAQLYRQLYDSNRNYTYAFAAS